MTNKLRGLPHLPNAPLAEVVIVSWLAGPSPSVLEVVRHAGFDQRLGPGRMLFSAREAIARSQALGAAPGRLPKAEAS